MISRSFSIAGCLVFLALASISVASQKLTTEELVAKHLDSIAEIDKRTGLKNLVARGNVSFTALRQAGTGGDGQIVMASDAERSLIGMAFRIPNYPGETIVYDGKKLKVAFASGNARSYLGDYLFRFDDIVKEGLLGGTLARSWTLANLDLKKPKLKYDGTKSVEGREAVVLDYTPRRGSDLNIKLYFDSKTFQHIRTEYRATIAVQQGQRVGGSGSGADAADRSSQQREVRQTLTEDFSNFKKVNDINLPHSHKMYLRLEDIRGVREYEFKSEYFEFFFNQDLDPNSFNTAG